MAGIEQQATKKRRRRSRRDFGRTIARMLCVLFALIGAVPLGGGLLLRSEPLQDWAASETSRLLRQELGVEASFSVEMSLIPLRLAITDLSVPAKDGGAPALQADLAAISPRFFSLLAGRIDVGDIELEDTQVRLVIREDTITNVTYRFPQTDSKERPALTRAPFRSLAITNASVDLDLDGTKVVTEGIDIDAFAERNLSFDVALRTGSADISSKRALNEEATKTALDEDRLCALDVRMFLSKEQVVLRRLSLMGALDLDPAEGTAPECDGKGVNQIAVRLSQVKVKPKEEGLPEVRGHLMAHLPLALADRASPTLQGTGWAGFSGDIAMGGETKLPEITGQLTGEDMSLSGYVIAKELNAQVLVTGDVVQVPTLYAKWGNGEAHLEGLKVEPFKEKVPLSIEKIVTKDVDFPGVMRDVDVTEHSWVDWNFGDTVIKKVGGTIVPFYIDGGVEAQTRNFVVWDRGFDDPQHRHMVGLKRANVRGRWRAHAKALEFYDCDVAFGKSSLPVDLVRIGFRKTGLVVRLKEEGGKLDLADVSPVANVDLAGKSHIYVNLEGPNLHPILKGTLEVDDLVVGGFQAGDVRRSNLHFEPLFVEFSELEGQKGAMDYFLPAARLDFGGPASVEFTTAVNSQNFDVEEFFSAFHFDEDPRFHDISGTGTVSGQVRYLLGGPEDTCEGGRLMVSGEAALRETEIFEEKYGSGNAQFHFEWFDMDAGTHGMRVDVPSLSLRKGSGSIFGSLQVEPGGRLSGDFVGTQVPVSRVDALGELTSQADGFVTGVGQLEGTVDALAFSADVNVTPIKVGDSTLPSSELRVKLVPKQDRNARQAKLGTTGCGRAITPPFTLADFEADEPEGEFIVNGELFGSQVKLDDLTISRQNKKVLRGSAKLRDLDLGAVGAFAAGASDSLPSGRMSGDVDVGEFFLDDPYGSTAQIRVTDADLAVNDLHLALAKKQAIIRLSGGQIRTENLALQATTDGGQKGVLDAEVTVDRESNISATFDLRPTSLGVLAPAIPGVSRAEGKLSASFGLQGKVTSPTLTGFVEVEEGKMNLEGFSSPVSDLFVTIALDDSGLHVKKGQAKWGGGEIRLRGEAPLVNGELGRTDLQILARHVTLPVQENVRVGFDADLSLDVPPPSDASDELPRLSGEIDILSASYEKPMRITADISTLAARGEKTNVEGYDESKDRLRLDILLRSSKPLQVQNELVVATLLIDPAGLRLTGTNERFGAVGTVEVEQGGQVFLRRNEFEVQRGLVRFNDPTRLRPEVDVTAATEYRRYEDRGATQEGDQQSNADNAGGAPVAGNWRILLHAYGPPDELKVDLASDPPLAQDDIFLLLTVGLTRTELDQTQGTGVGSSVALEALGSLSGAESAVTQSVPVDEFRFGSSYSSRSGRTEPTVTIGKRLSRRIRASVTTSLSDSSEVRSNIEYRATDSLSVEGSYDNAGDVASAAGGNLGGDIRWRLEFQ